jgi:hypothetical protein
LLVNWKSQSLPLLAYLLLALTLRAVTFGNPLIHVDEQFYLLVGDRLLHGAIPYADIWDRKPIGLFLIYAAIRLLGGAGIIQYQLVALGFITATAFALYRLALRIAAPTGAWCAGAAYLCYMSVFGCVGGQSPVFFNLPMVIAALLLCDLFPQNPPHLIRHGAAIMALVGIAIQIKYSVVFEGIAFGLMLIWLGHRQNWPHTKLITAAVIWASVALAPTVLALLYYTYLGQANNFIFANFISIFHRHESLSGSFERLFYGGLTLIPLWLAIVVAPWFIPSTPSPARNFVRLWAVAAVAGFLIFGTWYDHYFAALIAPLCVLAAPMLGHRRKLDWLPSFILLGASFFGGLWVTFDDLPDHGTASDIARATALIEQKRGTGCLYINEGDPVLYHTTHSCLPTPYIFPNHLMGMIDAAALPVDPVIEVKRIMATHPSVVLLATDPRSLPENDPSRAVVLAALAHDYHRYAVTKIGKREYQFYTGN